MNAQIYSRIDVSLERRSNIAKKEAAKILSCRQERIGKLVISKRLAVVLFKGKAHYQREEVVSYADMVSSNWTMVEACKELQLTRFHLKQLLEANIFYVLQKPDSLNRDWVIDRTQCLELVQMLRKKSRKSKTLSATLSMAGVQRQGYSIVQLILSMLSGKLEYGVSDDKHLVGLKQFIGFRIN
ncbi:hypothetical protein TDB9533_02962 [Thalassocella blandensis]|nr:hypothetical protein TDB9533_02962 [Thalassocella blandensis]